MANKIVGYVRAPFNLADSSLHKLQVYPTSKDLRDLEAWRILDLNYSQLYMTVGVNGSHMVNYRVLEDNEGHRTYQPTNLIERAKRAVLKKLNEDQT